MRVLNFRAKKFAIGSLVVIIKTFINGNIILATGETGKIISESFISLPDMNLFDIRILDIKFTRCTISVGELIAEKYMEKHR